MMTESMVVTHNGNIMSHQRTANWAEREYMLMHAAVSAREAEIETECRLVGAAAKEAREKAEYNDYLDQATKNPLLQNAREATRAVMGIAGGARRSA
jgi:hypothetical protein